MVHLYAEVPPDEFRNGETYDLSTFAQGNTPIYVVEEASYGDGMGNGTIGIANFHIFEKEHSDLVAFGRGSHNYQAVIYRSDVDPDPKLTELLEKLDAYPFLDEDFHSEVEMDKSSAAVIESFDEISDEIIVPALVRYFDADPDGGDWLEASIETLRKDPPEGDESAYTSRWDQVVDSVFYEMQQWGSGDWFDYHSSSGDASINIQRIQRWLAYQPDDRVKMFLEPALAAINIPDEAMGPI